MRTVIPIDPVTRLEGHLKIEVELEKVNNILQVVDARATGTLFRGFERILVGLPPKDAPHLTQRICGVCPVAHAMASVNALEAASNTKVPLNAVLERNLVSAANFIDSHILHFYHLAAQDYISGPNMPPWQPCWDVDKRVSAADTNTLVAHYVAALDMRRKAHELGAVIGGRLPHVPSFIPGGITTVPQTQALAKVSAYLTELTVWIQNVYIPDVQLVGAVYSDYFTIGRGYGNLLSFGVFDQDGTGNNLLLKRGSVTAGSSTVQPVDLTAITEQVEFSWFDNVDSNKHPSVGTTTPVYPKGDAYSWLKAPRYKGAPQECGPLARMWVTGLYRNGISVMDRHVARAYEALHIAKAMATWVGQIKTGQPVYTNPTAITSGTGFGLTEAARGALGHWVSIANSKISRYQIITPTCWNGSPADGQGQHGPLERALIGTPVQNEKMPVEVLRVIHSIDPCMGCAVHVVRPGKEEPVAVLDYGIPVRA